MSRISICRGCQARQNGQKSRIAIPHTCGMEPKCIKIKRQWLQDSPITDDVDPVTDDVKRFYELEAIECESQKEELFAHKWESKWKNEHVSPMLRMMGIVSWKRRKCLVCGAEQDKTYYKNRHYPEIEVHRNGRVNVDCNPELAKDF